MSTNTNAIFNRGACMECRRLKTKCDRGVPCAPCVRRGCESICPSGLRARGSRNPSIEVEQLNRNIQSMTARIRQLEDALAAAHSQLPTSTTPSTPPSFFGPNSQSESGELAILAQPNRDSFTDPVKHQQRQRILGMLPRENTAWELVGKYYMNYGWIYHPVPKSHVKNVLLKRVYTNPCIASNAEISALFALFSLAIAGESLESGVWLNASQFHELSMSALQLEDVLGETKLDMIEAMSLQCNFLYMGTDSDSTQRAWNYLGITLRLAYGIGLHRDPKYLNLDEEECRRRRRLFHELVAFDAWQSVMLEQPAALHNSHFTTELPYDTVETLGCDPSFFRSKHAFYSETVLPTINEMLSSPIYSQVLLADKKVRSCTFPPNLQGLDVKDMPLELAIQYQQINLMKEFTLIKLHHDFFYKALEDTPSDPLSIYAPSVSTVLENSSSLLKRLRQISVELRGVIPRLHSPWEAAITCLTYMGDYIRKAPHGATTNSVYIQFEMGCKLVSDHNEDTNRISRLMSHLVELRQAVHTAVPHLCEGLRKALIERQQLDPHSFSAARADYTMENMVNSTSNSSFGSPYPINLVGSAPSERSSMASSSDSFSSYLDANGSALAFNSLPLESYMMPNVAIACDEDVFGLPAAPFQSSLYIGFEQNANMTEEAVASFLKGNYMARA